MAPRECSIADALEFVGKRWTLLAVRELSQGVRRFDQIARHTGASRDILAARLRELEALGAVTRQLYNEHPPRYEYHLTESGWELCDVLMTLMKWGDRHLNAGDPPLLLHHSCGNVLEPAVVCAHCGRPARDGSLRATGRGAVSALTPG